MNHSIRKSLMMGRNIIPLVLAALVTLAGLLFAPADASAQQLTSGVGGLEMTPNLLNGTSNIHNYGAPGKCIGIANNNAGIWNCTSNADQLWHYGSTNADGWYQIVNRNGKCLGLEGGNDAQGTQVVAWTCLGTSHPDQYWFPSGSPYSGANSLLNYKAYNDSSTPAAVIGVLGGSTSNGAPVVVWVPDRSPNQSWY